MSLIDRQAAIDILYNFAGCIVDTPNGDYRKAYEASRYKLETLPSAQIERKKGKWVFEEYPDGYYHSECSECKHYFIEDAYLKPYNFCPNCGADMRGEQNG